MKADFGRITEVAEVEAGVGGRPAPIVAKKELDRLDKHCRHFISLSPFLCISTTGADGRADVSPRGDPPGFVQVIDDRTIAIPDRPGNRRADTMKNILDNPAVGLIFLVPGIEEVLRLNGRAALVKDQDLMSAMTAKGHVPRLAIVIELDEVFFHCAKAVKRAELWNPAAQIDRADFPRFGEIIRDQRDPDGNAEALEDFVQDEYRNNIY